MARGAAPVAPPRAPPSGARWTGPSSSSSASSTRAGSPSRTRWSYGTWTTGSGRPCGVAEGDEIEGLVAGEADRYFPRTALPEHQDRILLAHSPYRDSENVRRHQETSLYRAPSGALVFASGTFAWSPALDRPGHVDPRIQRATANLLDRICKRD